MTNSKILQFPQKSEANSEPIIASDYFGDEKFDLLALLNTIERLKKEKGE
jgi:hypothetical protein